MEKSIVSLERIWDKQQERSTIAQATNDCDFFFVLFVLRNSFIQQPWLVWNSLCILGWPCTAGLYSSVLGLHAKQTNGWEFNWSGNQQRYKKKVFLVWHNSPLGTGAVSDAFVCSKDPCPPTELSQLPLIWGEGPSLVAAAPGMHLWLLFLGGLPFSGDKQRKNPVRCGRREGESYILGVMYERITLKKKKKWTTG